jgi:hypothetical protein
MLVLGRSLFLTIVSVCGSIALVSPNLNVNESPLFTFTVPGAKNMLSWMYRFGTKVTPLSLARTTTPPCADVDEPRAYVAQLAARPTTTAKLTRYLVRLKVELPLVDVACAQSGSTRGVRNFQEGRTGQASPG